ncbi:MAG: Gfo/Idh/MocA family oxidoreductase [Dysgonamonadaceae bacterium]|jgi:predicted dehydrogenase|nr:Gfo/Idh/MocA family oxidoreductase [Dysgonamonadaceae bacterium]
MICSNCGESKQANSQSNRPAGQESVLKLAVDPIPTVRIGFIGLGNRGESAVYRYTFLEGVEIKALCDLKQDYIDRAQKQLADKSLPKADEYIGQEAWKQLCERDDIDLVYICTDWLTHTPMAVYAMQHGKHVAVEVPAATTLQECWDLVNTAEKTRKHCMMLENCCYDFFELNTLNMVQQGLFGELVHGEGAYIHDLRSLNFDGSGESKSYYVNMWRLRFNEQHTGNPYPTHGLGPICQAFNIHRGDKLNYLVSVSTNQFGMTEYAKQKFGDDSPEAQQEYSLGDMNTTIIRTELGKTIVIQHDVTSPRPYNRHHILSGTKGFAQKYPVQGIALEPQAHSFVPAAQFDSLMTTYKHPFIQEIGEYAKKVGGHGGMDFIMDYRLIHCLRNGLPLDQDVYDAAEWSCLVELTEQSVKAGGKPVEIPDFTRGEWNKLNGLNFAK